MGFGYLLIGYLLAFVIYLTLQALQVGSLALLGGYALMLWGLTLLCRYHRTFVFARWLSALQLLPGLYFLAVDLGHHLSFGRPMLDEAVQNGFRWGSFGVQILFLLSLLYAVRALAEEVELPKTSSWALCNMLFVGVHALLFLLGELPVMAAVRNYLTLSIYLLELVSTVSIALLLLSCNKNICPAGDEEVQERESRFGWINRMTSAYEKNRERLREDARADGEAFRRRHEERKRQKAQERKNKRKK